MIVNLEKDLLLGNKVCCYLKSNTNFKYDGIVELLKFIEDGNTFIEGGSLYSHKKYLVRYEDGFETHRKIYYIVEDSASDVPEEYIDRYTYNLEKPYVYYDEIPDEYGGNF
jgi:hypothetical protein